MVELPAVRTFPSKPVTLPQGTAEHGFGAGGACPGPYADSWCRIVFKFWIQEHDRHMRNPVHDRTAMRTAPRFHRTTPELRQGV